jgi:Lipase (class 3)
MAINWKDALHYGSLVKIAEQVRPSGISDCTFQLKSVGYELLQTLYANDLSTDLDMERSKLEAPVTMGFIALSAAGELVAIIRGTATILEWVHDADFLMVPSNIAGWCFVDDGFESMYRSLRIGKLTPDAPTISAKNYIKSQLETGVAKTVTICGHSLGGALATLLTLDVALNTSCKNPISYTFASPRVGDHRFALTYRKSVTQSYRIANRLDLVTMLPTIFPLPYEHVDNHCELKPDLGKISFIVTCMHHMTSYLWLMDQLAGSNSFALDADCAA